MTKPFLLFISLFDFYLQCLDELDAIALHKKCMYESKSFALTLCLTCFATTSSIAQYTGTRIAVHSVSTSSSMHTRLKSTLVDICENLSSRDNKWNKSDENNVSYLTFFGRKTGKLRHKTGILHANIGNSQLNWIELNWSVFHSS